MSKADNFLFVEKYRPHRVADLILPSSLQQSFAKFVEEKKIPTLLLVGGAGTGKTSSARAMLDELGADYIFINASLNGNIDTLRNEIQQFASSASFMGGRKYVILDESDRLTQATQEALRAFIEEFSKNCGFILTANYKNKIIDPLHSRCAVIDFTIPNEEKGKIAVKIYQRIIDILIKENISFDKAAIKELVKQYFPDMRRMINELQFYASQGYLGSNIIRSSQDAYNFDELVGFLKVKDFTSVRKWIGENDPDPDVVFKFFYDNLAKLFTSKTIPVIVLSTAKYQFQNVASIDKQINLSAYFVEIMIEGTFL